MKILNVTQQLKKTPWELILDKFMGTATLLDDALLGDKFAKESINLIQVQDGRWKTRWGRAYYGLALTGEATILGAGEYTKTDGTRETIAIGSTTGKAYKSTNGGAWTEITGATFNVLGKTIFFKQINNYLYICNGLDFLTRYNGTVLSRYSVLAAPTNLAGTRGAGISAGSYHNYYKVTALNDVGETVGSAELDVTSNTPRIQWNPDAVPATNQYIDLTWDAVASALKYQIYYSTETGKELLLFSSDTNSGRDDNSYTENPYSICPTQDSTGAPKFSMISVSDNVIWGVAPEFPWRVFWSGTGINLGRFATAYGGGWVDLDYGSEETVQYIEHYRTGKGDTATTVFCKTPEGTGSIWQVSLVAIAISTDENVIAANTLKIVGSIGTSSPGAVVKAGDSLIFPNKSGIYQLGTKAQIVNVLSTDELSGNIRPSYRSLNMALASQFVGFWYDSKIFFSAAEGTGENDMIFIFDTERHEWNWKWTFGVRQFLEYTDSTGLTHFLAVAPTGNQLVEISQNIMGDFGTPIVTSYISGLIPINADQSQFAKVDEVLLTLGRPQGTIYFEILGISKSGGFSSISTKQISNLIQSNEFWKGDLGEILLDDNEDAPTTYDQASVKKRQRVGKLLNNIQFHIYSNSANTDFTIIGVQAKGKLIPTRAPSNWN